MVNSRKVLRAKLAFYISLLVTISIILIVFLIGPKNIYNDLLTSVSILSLLLFFVITGGLYKGMSVVDDMPKLTNKFKFSDFFLVDNFDTNKIEIDFGEGISGIIFGVLFWIIFTFLISFLLSMLLASIWSLILVIIMVLYWIFYRAVRLIFRKSEICKGNLMESIKYGLLYTVLYSIWFYAILYLSNFYNKA